MLYYNSAIEINHLPFTQTDSPIGVPGDDIPIEARGDEQTRVCVVLYVLHPASVAMQRTHLPTQVPQVPECISHPWVSQPVLHLTCVIKHGVGNNLI